MDDTSFDALARSLSTSRSRRGVARLLGGFILTGPLLLLGERQVEAKKKHKKRKKHKRDDDSTTTTATACAPKCGDKQCGGNGCGGSCGTCSDPCTECQGGQCVAKAEGAACGTAAAPGQCIAGRCALGCGDRCWNTCNACASTFDVSATLCAKSARGCAALTKPCQDHSNCDANELCTFTTCTPINGMTSRCQALCDA